MADSVHVAVEQVFEINDLKAFKTIVISVASYSLGLLMIAKAPWYLLPLAWAWTGTAITGVCSTWAQLAWLDSCLYVLP